MENFIKDLREFLKGRRNIGRDAYKLMSRAYRTVEKGATTWDYVIDILGGAR